MCEYYISYWKHTWNSSMLCLIVNILFYKAKENRKIPKHIWLLFGMSQTPTAEILNSFCFALRFCDMAARRSSKLLFSCLRASRSDISLACFLAATASSAYKQMKFQCCVYVHASWTTFEEPPKHIKSIMTCISNMHTTFCCSLSISFWMTSVYIQDIQHKHHNINT